MDCCLFFTIETEAYLYIEQDVISVYACVTEQSLNCVHCSIQSKSARQKWQLLVQEASGNFYLFLTSPFTFSDNPLFIICCHEYCSEVMVWNKEGPLKDWISIWHLKHFNLFKGNLSVKGKRVVKTIATVHLVILTACFNATVHCLSYTRQAAG